MKERGIRKKLIGVVVSNSMDKTAVVQVSRLKKHRTYKKYIMHPGSSNFYRPFSLSLAFDLRHIQIASIAIGSVIIAGCLNGPLTAISVQEAYRFF